MVTHKINLALNAGIRNSAIAACAPMIAAEIQAYPDPYAVDLRRALAEHLSVPMAHLFVGWGGGNCLIEAFECLLAARDRPVIVANDLTYLPFKTYCKARGAEIVESPLGADLGIDLDDMARRVRETRADAVYLVNPNNPTGIALADTQALLKLIHAHPQTCFFIDEAYIDYVQDPQAITLVDATRRLRNLLVFRTFSKAYGMAGLKLGYVVADESIISRFRTAAIPYRVSNLQVLLGIFALKDRDHLDRARAINAAQIRQLTGIFRRNFADHLRVYDSCTNFILARSRSGRCLSALQQTIEDDGYVLKKFPEFPDCLRISTTEESQFSSFSTYLQSNIKRLKAFME